MKGFGNWGTSAKVFEAVERGDAIETALLLESNPKLIEAERNKMTLLNVAAAAGRHELIELLIDKGAKVNAMDGNGMTALHYAARHGQTKVIEVLIANGADVNSRDKWGNAPLIYAVPSLESMNSLPKNEVYSFLTLGKLPVPIEVVQLLVEKGSDADALYYALKTVDLVWTITSGIHREDAEFVGSSRPKAHEALKSVVHFLREKGAK